MSECVCLCVCLCLCLCVYTGDITEPIPNANGGFVQSRPTPPLRPYRLHTNSQTPSSQNHQLYRTNSVTNCTISLSLNVGSLANSQTRRTYNSMMSQTLPSQSRPTPPLRPHRSLTNSKNHELYDLNFTNSIF